jgi:hypothetical protein
MYIKSHLNISLAVLRVSIYLEDLIVYMLPILLLELFLFNIFPPPLSLICNYLKAEFLFPMFEF